MLLLVFSDGGGQNVAVRGVS